MPCLISSETAPRDVYFLMTSLVVPRPIAWISTVSNDGVRNLAPYSHFTNCSSNPPIVLFSSTGVKDTLRNIEATGEFVINVVTHHTREQMRITAAEWPSEADEISKAGLSTLPSKFVRPERVKEASASMECRLRTVMPMGSAYVVFGDVLCFHVADDVMVDGRITANRLQPVGKLDASNYVTVTETERIDLPSDFASEVSDFDKARR